MVDSDDALHTSLVVARTRVAPIKRLTVPRLKLCGAVLLAKLLHHVARILGVSLDGTFVFTDNLIVLGWVKGNPRNLKTSVEHRVSTIVELIPPDHWHHISSKDNPADLASRGIIPAEL